MKLLLIFFLLGGLSLHAQDEMSQEINKLETGQIEDQKSDVQQEPAMSANQTEQEIKQEDLQKTQPETKSVENTDQSSPAAEPSQDSAIQEIKPDESQETKNSDVAPSTPTEQTEEPAEVEEQQQATAPEPAPEPEKEEAPAQVAATQQETAPSDFEERLNRIYNKFYAESTSDQAWTQIAGEKIKETYTIQPGDTLWGISVTFFGNGFYWPKVWSMNDDITNPHNISAGYVLKFTPGKMDQAPQINLSKNDSQPTDSAKSENIAANSTTESDAIPLIPPPDKKYVPVLKDLPDSLPYIRGPKIEGFSKDGFSVDTKKIAIQPASVVLPAYLSAEEPEHLGKVVEFEDDDQSRAAPYDVVYVRFDSPVHVGDTFVTYHLDDKVHDFHGNNEGRPVVLEGEIKIESLVNQEKNVYRAKVLRTVNFVDQGSYVMRGSLIVGTTSETSNSGNVSAEIVGGIRESKQIMAGDQDVVYLGKGTQDGIHEGETFDVYKNMDARKSSTYIKDLKEKIGRIKVLKTTPERSTAIVLDSSARILPGDFIGAKEVSRNDNIQDQDFDSETSDSSSNDNLENSDSSPNIDQKSDSDDDLLNE